MTTTESVLIIRFPGNSQAYQALSDLRVLADSGTGLDVRSAALVERTPDGALRVPEGDDATIGVGTAAGGLAGMVVGILGGPLGVLLGFGAGALIGSITDVNRAGDVDSALAFLSAQIPAGSTALIVEAAESSPEPIDQFAAKFGASVERRPAAEVAGEADAAEEAAEAARLEADRVLREHKRAEVKAKIDDKVDAMKDKLQRR